MNGTEEGRQSRRGRRKRSRGQGREREAQHLHRFTADDARRGIFNTHMLFPAFPDLLLAPFGSLPFPTHIHLPPFHLNVAAPLIPLPIAFLLVTLPGGRSATPSTPDASPSAPPSPCGGIGCPSSASSSSLRVCRHSKRARLRPSGDSAAPPPTAAPPPPATATTPPYASSFVLMLWRAAGWL